MTYRLEPQLVNGRFGDPALYIGFEFEKRGLLLDIGDVSALSPAKLRQVSDLFVSHAHLDHFAGFDQLLRYQLELNRTLNIYGPSGITEQVEHKLAAYSWNLEAPASAGLDIFVTEIESLKRARRTGFSLREGFQRGSMEDLVLANGRILEDHDVVVDSRLLDHNLPCLAFSVCTRSIANIVEEKLSAAQLPTGPWLYRFKQALRHNLPAETLIAIDESDDKLSLGELEELLTEPATSYKIGYVTDCQFNSSNAKQIVDLVKDADILFIEAKFADADSAIAKARYHLTTTQAGSIAARAKAERIEVFHFSERYQNEEARMLEEVQSTFQGTK